MDNPVLMMADHGGLQLQRWRQQQLGRRNMRSAVAARIIIGTMGIMDSMGIITNNTTIIKVLITITTTTATVMERRRITSHCARTHCSTTPCAQRRLPLSKRDLAVATRGANRNRMERLRRSLCDSWDMNT